MRPRPLCNKNIILEFELLMTLAWANLNRTPPDRAAAERHATAALALVPHWRYLRDILIPQIRKEAL